MKGLTLIELMASMAILSIVLSTGLPAMSGLFESYRAKTSLFSLRTALMSARTIALTNTQETIICPVKDLQCVSDWSQPLVIFTDINRNFTIEPDETIHLTVSNEIQQGYWQKKKSNQHYIRFTPQGHAFSSATTFLYCPSSGKKAHAKQLVINFQGRIRTNSYLSKLGTPFAAVAPLSCP
jgi:type IV fimbrial biogenesis protein FimT